jgi:drug/metabolite transporter (DMT)-like permease
VAVLFGILAGAFFGALTVAIRLGLRRGGDPAAGALALVLVATAVSAVLAAPSAVRGFDVGDLWPFVVAGAFAPGASQIVLNHAIRHAGASRTSILIGTAPLMSVLIALALLDEPAQPELLAGTVLVVAGGVALAREGVRPEQFRALGAGLALACAALFAARDNVFRWAARDAHPPPLVAATASLLAAAAVLLLYFVLVRRRGVLLPVRSALLAFAPAGVALGLAYDALAAAFDRGRVSVVAPLNATQSLWGVLLAALLIGRSEAIGRRLVAAGALVVTGAALIGAVR